METAEHAARAKPPPWWSRPHAALMPDYNRKATAYWCVMVLLGAVTLGGSLAQLSGLPAHEYIQIGVIAAMALLAGFFPVRIPRSTNSFAAGEIFIFLLLLLNGPAVAAAAAAGENLVGVFRTSKRWTSRIVSPAMAAVSMFATGSIMNAGLDAARAHGLDGAAALMTGMTAGALLYFVINTLLIAAVPYLKRSQWPTPGELFGNFGWISSTYIGSASVACLLFLTYQQSGFGVLMAAVPIIGMLLSTLHFYFRHQAADEAVRTGRVEAVEREAVVAARHVAELQVSERRFHSAFTHASVGMALVGFDGRVLQANVALCALLGLDDDGAILRQPFVDFVAPEEAAALSGDLAALHSQRSKTFALELRLRHGAGAEVWATVHGSFFSEFESEAPCLILQVQNITERRHAEAGLQHMAFHDALTGLPNRRRFNDHLEAALGASRTDTGRHFGLMFFDFDRFKLINDSLGHAVGDEFLIQVAGRIRENVRPRDIVARLGGDEFAVLVEERDGGERYVVTLAERLLEILRQPLQIAGNEITTSASIGITFSGMGYATPADMLRDADTAMYKAKAGGKARYALFDSSLHDEVSVKLRLEGDLRRALATGGLAVAYQPLFDLTAGCIVGFEALARWEHPELGTIAPKTFIAVAEEASLMLPLTDFVLRQACAQLSEWQLRDERFASLTMNVNISGADIAHPGFVSRVTSALVEARLNPQFLILEITENILMERLEAALPTLGELRRLGISLSVDDFGTGYTSLRHLSSLPVNSLKIDRAFVADLRHGGEGAAVMRAIIALGHSLGKTVVAEGIETEAQMEQLREMGCSAGQGFHLSRPLAPREMDRLLEGMTARGPGASFSGARFSRAAPVH